ncbi:MAG: presenilin family intramembrane aspartyl protease [Candidatus Pacearchaeota archaeon]
MKHNLKINLIIILMFFITQLIGLFVIHSYTPIVKEVNINGTIQNVTINPIPYGMQPPSGAKAEVSLITIISAFVIAILIILFLTQVKAALILRLWFFFVVTIVLAISFNAILMNFTEYSSSISIIIAIILSIFKIFKRDIIIHNLTELFIYPGIAVVFVSMLNLWSIILFLILISIYDIWAVWHSGIMQKMAKYQINEMKVFAGFFIPYVNKKHRAMLKDIQKVKSSRLKKAKLKKIKVGLAILGGGDVVFPIIAAGIIFRSLGLSYALIVSTCATISLMLLLFFSKKGKFYPAMPFLTAGIITGIIISYFCYYFFV